MRPQDDIDAAEANDRQLEQLAKRGKAESDFVLAVRTARQTCEEAGLDLTFDDFGHANLSEFQVHKAIRYTKEDASAALILQVVILKRLDRNQKYSLVIIALLVSILFRISGIW
jgi:hypothetical protein